MPSAARLVIQYHNAVRCQLISAHTCIIFQQLPFLKVRHRSSLPTPAKSKTKTLYSFNLSQKKYHTIWKSQIARLTSPTKLQEYGRNKHHWNRQINNHITQPITSSILKQSSSIGQCQSHADAMVPACR